jgi:hypothetical protein
MARAHISGEVLESVGAEEGLPGGVCLVVGVGEGARVVYYGVGAVGFGLLGRLGVDAHFGFFA